MCKFYRMPAANQGLNGSLILTTSSLPSEEGVNYEIRSTRRSDAGAPGVAVQDGGPIEDVTGIQGVSESVDPPNNNGHERTLLWTEIQQAVNALLPFVDQGAASKAGFDTTKSFPFVPFVPVLPTPLGDFHSFKG